jgi:hypothetical protein
MMTPATGKEAEIRGRGRGGRCRLLLRRRSERSAAATRRGDATIASLALPLRDAGLTDELIAECLAMQPEALDPLLHVPKEAGRDTRRRTGQI